MIFKLPRSQVDQALVWQQISQAWLTAGNLQSNLRFAARADEENLTDSVRTEAIGQLSIEI